jgi:hypothetical protein
LRMVRSKTKKIWSQVKKMLFLIFRNIWFVMFKVTFTITVTFKRFPNQLFDWSCRAEKTIWTKQSRSVPNQSLIG